jgi:hypothetical protein
MKFNTVKDHGHVFVDMVQCIVEQCVDLYLAVFFLVKRGFIYTDVFLHRIIHI